MAARLVLTFLLLGCGRAHNAPDAGPPIATCEALLAAEEGTACADPAERCLEGAGLCATRLTRCEAGAVVHEALEGDPEFEPPDCEDGDIEVTGPSGTFRHGVLGGGAGFTDWGTLFLYPDEPFTRCPTQYAGVTFHPVQFPELSYLGELPAEGVLRLGGVEHPIRGTVHVTVETDDVLEGTLSLRGDDATLGGGLDGRFRVRWCDDLVVPSL